MKSPLFALLTLALLCVSGPAAFPMDAKAREEIDFPIREVETSGSRFIRNGQEHSAQEGAAHLREKLAGAGDRIKTAEDFITGAASKSLLAGKPYQIKSPGGKETPVGSWLSEKLSKHRHNRQD